jgi:hypothetical protein
VRRDPAFSLRDGLEDLEAERFVGREEELRAIAVAGRQPAGGIVFVHGPAGIGKSALLGAARRRHESAGGTAFRLPAAREAPSAEVLAEMEAAPRPLVAIDDLGRGSLMQAWLRETLLPVLPGGAVVLIASRQPPSAALLAGPLGSAVRTLELEPLGEQEARALLAARGVAGPDADAALEWARGWPAALVLAAARQGEIASADEVVARLAGEELDAVVPEVLGVAALARVLDARTLAAVAGVAEPEEALRQLGRLTVVRRGPAGVELHPLLRRALREEMREAAPDRERELRRRLADHLHLRACSGEGWTVVDLAGLIENPALRWGYGGGDTGDLRAGSPRREDLPRLRRAVVARWDASWWEGTERWLLEAPDACVVVRDRDGGLRGFCIATSLPKLPPWAAEDPVLGAWIAHAEAASSLGQAVLWRDVLALGDDGDRGRALLNAAAVMRSGVANPRWFYGPVDPRDERELALAEAVGARHLPDLDIRADGHPLQCHLIDHGPGGVVGLVRDVVYAELGMAPRRAPSEDQVRDALRALRQPARLVGSPFTPDGLEAEEQRREVRARLTAAADSAFGNASEERLLRAVLDNAYLEEGEEPGEGPRLLSVSRATYYRRLRTATERLCRQLARDS